MQNPITKLQLDVEMLKTCYTNMIRPATVSYVYRKKGDRGIELPRDDGKHIGFVDVISGEIELERIPVYTPHNQLDTVLWLPTKGEDGTIFSANGDLANAFFVSTIPTDKQPIPDPDGPATETIVTKIRGDNKEELILKNESDEEINQYTHEIGVRDESHMMFVHGDNFVKMNKDEIIIDHNGDQVKIDSNQILIKSDNKKIEQRINTTLYKEITTILANIIGAHFYPSGLTTIVSPAGNCFFAPTPSPVSAPALPSGSESNADGVVTKTPDENINDVGVRSGSDLTQTWNLETMSLVIQTPIPVVTPAGPGTIAAGTYPIRLTGTPDTPVIGELNITLPGRDL